MTPPTLSEGPLAAWRKDELALSGTTVATAESIKEDGADSLLDAMLYGRVAELVNQFDVKLDITVVAGILPGARSSLGNTSERLLELFAEGAVADVSSPLVAYRSGSSFEAAIKEIRRNDRELPKDQARVARKTAQLQRARRDLAVARKETTRADYGAEVDRVTRELETLQCRLEAYPDRTEAIADVARKFRVTIDHVTRLVDDVKREIVYPDAAAFFVNETRCTQMKLSGQTDKYNTRKNVEVLIEQTEMFRHLGVPVTAAVVLPCEKRNAVSTWTKALAKQKMACRLYVNEQIMEGLFEAVDPGSWYDEYLEALTAHGADRVFSGLAPEGVEFSEAARGWVRTGAAPDAATWTIRLPHDLPPEEEAAALELMAKLESLGVVD